ncbi:MBL fold metallo-hydrolase [Chitinophaga agrisoli]|uniref:MBL fold metallo-hydrolase n=1 Tax=Chitinophaga agrisoli TaxID=2607653 RepID=A0A5B2VKD8_9BACT|nr:MBL fold metallo-hydrolase [Chitinophaga agrisoli]KAA2239050.1 MBL fold metallo-hydrolase [Chitinophaga agrisoli]
MKSAMNVIYIGGPTVILEIGGLRLMTDPTLDPKGETFSINGKPAYWKSAGPAITDIPPIDVVLLSHDQHGDNLDNAGRELMKAAPVTYTTKIGAERLQGNALGLAPWESVTVPAPEGGEITITGTPARHGPMGVEKITGDVTGFVVSYQDRQLYITGDTVFYEGIKEVAARFAPQHIFIFAGAAKPRGPFNVTMGTNDAIDTAFTFPQATIIPVHFEGWSHYTETGEMLQQSFNALGIGEHLRILPPGERVAL